MEGIRSNMICGNETQFPQRPWVTSEQNLTNRLYLRRPLSQDIQYKISVQKSSIGCLKNSSNTGCQSYPVHIRPLKVQNGLELHENKASFKDVCRLKKRQDCFKIYLFRLETERGAYYMLQPNMDR
jgi:hypothetical protein